MGIEQSRTWRGRVFTNMSLDGFIAARDGDPLWVTRLSENLGHIDVVAEGGALTWSDFFPRIDAVMLGRLTYERLQHLKRWPFEDTPVYVVSRTFPPGDPRISGVFRKPEDAIATLNKLGIEEAYIDGGRTVQGFLRRGLIDELTVSIAPVLLGDGIPLFGNLGKHINLRVIGSNVTDSGFVRVTYGVKS